MKKIKKKSNGKARKEENKNDVIHEFCIKKRRIFLRVMDHNNCTFKCVSFSFFSAPAPNIIIEFWHKILFMMTKESSNFYFNFVVVKNYVNTIFFFSFFRSNRSVFCLLLYSFLFVTILLFLSFFSVLFSTFTILQFRFCVFFFCSLLFITIINIQRMVSVIRCNIHFVIIARKGKKEIYYIFSLSNEMKYYTFIRQNHKYAVKMSVVGIIDNITIRIRCESMKFFFFSTSISRFETVHNSFQFAKKANQQKFK